MMNRELTKALRPVKNRIRRNRFWRGAAAGLAAGLGFAFALQAVSFFAPVPDRGLWAAAAAGTVMLLTACGNALRSVRDKEAARAADNCGLQERVITAIEDGDEPIRRLQRHDACNALKKLDVRKIRPGSVRKPLCAALICAVLSGCLLLIPSPQDSAADARKTLIRTLREGWETIARAAEEDEVALTEEEKSELRKITGDLNRELDKSRDAADALVALDRAEQRLEQFRQKTAGEAAAAEGEAGENENRAEGSQNDISDDKRTAGTASQTGSGQQGSAGATPSAGQMKTLQAAATLKSAVNPSTRGMAAMTVTGMQGIRSGETGSGASGAGNGNTGKGTGSGAGEGSTNEEESGGGNSSDVHNQGSRPPKYKEEQYETIYDPEYINRTKQDVVTDQYKLSEEDAIQLETGPGKGNLSGDVPWSEALQDYADTEARAADRENLTMKERQWVDEYYRLLTEQQ